MTLRLYFDEDVDPSLALLLIRDGVDVITRRDAGRASLSISDAEQLQFAAANGRAIFTFNAKDYIRLSQEWYEAGIVHAGIIVSPKRPLAELRRRFRAFILRYPDGMQNVCDYL